MSGQTIGVKVMRKGAHLVGLFFLCAAAAVTALVATGSAPTPTAPTPVLSAAGSSAVVPIPCSPGTFCIGGDAVAGLFPGATALATTVTITNPNPFSITVSTLSASAGTTTNRSSGTCPGSDVSVTPFSGSLTVPANSTIPTNLPITLVTGTANACQGAQWPLNYVGTATPNYNCTGGTIASTQKGGVTVAGGKTTCVTSGGSVSGGITVKPGGALILMGGNVSGGITSNSASWIDICSSTVTGGVTISGSTGAVLIGAGSSCAGNSVSGGLAITNNTGGIEIFSNSVTGGMTITGNSGPSAGSLQYVEGNHFSGGLTCSGNAAGLSDGTPPVPNTGSGPRTGQCVGSF